MHRNCGKHRALNVLKGKKQLFRYAYHVRCFVSTAYTGVLPCSVYSILI